MTTSYNGWPASKSPADFGGLDNSPVPGTNVKLAPGVRAGDVATVLFHFAAQLHARVEAAVDPGCWGYFYKNSANSAALLSCHSSATAFDWNAPKHPNGRYGTWTAQQIAEVRRIQAEHDGLIYWGEDRWGNGTIDGMHFEIREGVTAAQIAALAARIRGGDVTPAPAPAPAQSPDPKASPLAFQYWYNAYNFVPALPVVSPTANAWGPQSDAALKRVQARYGLEADGIPGPQTRALLARLGYHG